MIEKIEYHALYSEGKIHRLYKYIVGGTAYAWENGKWVESTHAAYKLSGFSGISDYDEITEDQAIEYMRQHPS